MSLGFDVWNSVVSGHTIPLTPPSTTDEKRAFECNAKAMNAILCGLSKPEFIKFMHCGIAQAMWDKLKNAYEGDEKAKKVKLQTHRMQFESLRMKKEENVAAYFLRVDEFVNSLKGLGEKFEDSVAIHKILRSLPLRFDAKIYAIEEMVDLDKMSIVSFMVYWQRMR